MNELHSEKINNATYARFQCELVHEERSEFQHIKIYRSSHYGNMLVLDGLCQTTANDAFIYHETVVNVPYCALKEPAKRILIIGGGDGAALEYALRHESVEEAVMVEIDDAVVRVSKKYLPFGQAFDDPRAKLVIADGAKFVKDASQKGLYDIAIVDSSDIHTPAAVLYTEEFYSDLRDCLTPQGIIIHQTNLPDAHSPVALQVSYAAVKKLYPFVTIGWLPVLSYGGLISFVVGSFYDVTKPRREIFGKWYTPAMHQGFFAVPNYWNDYLK
ncbi:MAG: polyamine aminopropyltransferase [Planctomycetota bacterium]